MDDADSFPLEVHYAEEMSLEPVARLQRHYQGIDTYAIHKSGNRSGDDFVYGDTAVPVLYRLLKRWGLGPQDHFLDLGCGCGMAVLAASLLAGRAEGVDVVEPVIDFCRRSAQLLEIGNVAFHHQDILETDLSKATFVYLAWVTFPVDLREQICFKLKECRKGTKVLSVTARLTGKAFMPVVTVPQTFAWNGRGEGFKFDFHLHVRR